MGLTILILLVLSLCLNVLLILLIVKLYDHNETLARAIVTCNAGVDTLLNQEFYKVETVPDSIKDHPRIWKINVDNKMKGGEE